MPVICLLLMLLFLLLLLLLLLFFFSCCSDSDYCRCCPVCRAHLRLPAAWRHPVVRPDSTGSCWRTRQSPPNPLARFRCRYGPMRETLACSDRSGRAACVAPWPALLASRQKDRRDVGGATPFRKPRFTSLRRVPARCSVRCHSPV